MNFKGLAPLLSRLLPLPQGEGWGEGEVNTLIFQPLVLLLCRL